MNVMRMNMNLKDNEREHLVQIARIAYIAISALFCIGGAMLLFYQNVPYATLTLITGITLMVCGVVKLLGYFSKDLYRLAFQFDLAMGVFVVLAGVFVITQGKNLMDYYLPLTGVLVLFDSLLKIQTAVDAKKFGLHKWWLIGGLAILTSLVGIISMFIKTNELPLTLICSGIAYLLDGMLNLAVAICAVKIMKKKC